jgi:hypothetical protein
MCFFFSLIPATFLVTIGYFVLFASSKAAVAGIKTFGFVLAIWIFLIALIPPIAGAYITLSGQCPIEQVLKGLSKPSIRP